jgi:hypothetical protein
MEKLCVAASRLRVADGSKGLLRSSESEELDSRAELGLARRGIGLAAIRLAQALRPCPAGLLESLRLALAICPINKKAGGFPISVVSGWLLVYQPSQLYQYHKGMISNIKFSLFSRGWATLHGVVLRKSHWGQRGTQARIVASRRA